MVYTFGYYENEYSTKCKSYKRLKLSTGEKIHPKYWNKEKNRARTTSSFPEGTELNARLDQLDHAIRETHIRLKRKGIKATPDKLKDELPKTLGENKENNGITLFRFFENVIAQGKDQKQSPRTLKNYRCTLNHVLRFCKEERKEYHFEDIDFIFYDKFMKYLNDNTPFAPNSVGKHVSVIKAILNKAVERKYTNNLEYKGFKVPYEEPDMIYLNEEELTRIQNLNLNNNKRLDRIRDLFLIGCYTGLRFSDFTQIDENNIKKDGNNYVLQIKTQKTNQVVVIPLKSIIVNILQKYNYNIPNHISNQKMNSYLKELGKLAEINENITIYKTRNNERTKEILKKWELICTHTARRSFATNAYKSSPDLSYKLMKITGHKTERNFLRYIRINSEENAKLLMDSPFFK
ncbi:MAG: site-specific integrase [Bacteroidia bacterium]|nr:site-specific integrase [Bacteroidia bacterium]